MTREEAEAIVTKHTGHFDWQEAMVEELLAAVAAEREARDAKWRAWLERNNEVPPVGTWRVIQQYAEKRDPPPDREP